MSAPVRPVTRPIGSIRPRLAVLTALVLVLSGCTGEPAGTVGEPTVGSGSASQSPASTPSPSTTASEVAVPPPAGPAPTTGVTVFPTGEVPHDPMQRTIIGVVRRAGGCTVLVVGERRWPLTGPLAAALPVGETRKVTGNLTQLPGSCPNETGPAIEVTAVSPG